MLRSSALRSRTRSSDLPREAMADGVARCVRRRKLGVARSPMAASAWACAPMPHPVRDTPRAVQAPELSEVAESGAGGSLARAGAWLAPAVFVALWFAPLPLSTEAHRLAAIAGAVLIAWVTEVVPIAVTATLIG